MLSKLSHQVGTTTVALFLAAATTATPVVAQEVDLRPKFVPGASSTLVMTIRSTTRVKPTGGVTPAPAPGAKPEPDTSSQQSDQEITFTEKVVDWNPETGGTVQLVYDRVKMKITSDAIGEVTADTATLPGGKPTNKPKSFDPFESQVPAEPSSPKSPGSPGANPPPAPRKDAIDQAIEDAVKPNLTGVAGTVLTLKVDAAGNITSVTGGERLAVGGLFGPGMALPNSADGLKGLFGPIRPQATPGKPGPRPGYSMVGDKWTTASEVVLGPTGPLNIKTDHELKSVRNGEAQISFKGKVESQSQGQTPGTGGAPLIKIPAATYRGNYTWDAKAGQLKKMESEQHTEAESPLGTMESESTMRIERQGGAARPKVKL